MRKQIENYSITAGTNANFPEVITLWKESVLASHDFLRKEDFEELESQMGTIFLPAIEEIWLYRINNELAGFCGCNGAFVEMLFVHPKFMRRKVGSTLLEHVMKLRGTLILDVNEENKKALDFYLRLGFKIVGRSPLDNQGRSYPLLHLELKMPDALQLKKH